MWGRDTSLLEWIQRIKGSLVLDTKRGRQMSFLKGGRCRDTFTIVYYRERESTETPWCLVCVLPILGRVE